MLDRGSSRRRAYLGEFGFRLGPAVGGRFLGVCFEGTRLGTVLSRGSKRTTTTILFFGCLICGVGLKGNQKDTNHIAAPVSEPICLKPTGPLLNPKNVSTGLPPKWSCQKVSSKGWRKPTGRSNRRLGTHTHTQQPPVESTFMESRVVQSLAHIWRTHRKGCSDSVS